MRTSHSETQNYIEYDRTEEDKDKIDDLLNQVATKHKVLKYQVLIPPRKHGSVKARREAILRLLYELVLTEEQVKAVLHCNPETIARVKESLTSEEYAGIKTAMEKGVTND